MELVDSKKSVIGLDLPLGNPLEIQLPHAGWSSIPKILHRVWLDEPIPEQYERYWQAFEELHPDWELVTWNSSAQLYWMHNLHIFDNARTWAGKSDVVRYEVIAHYGGVYVDTDVEPLRSFDELLEDPRPFAAWESSRLLCPTVIGAPPYHPAMWDLLRALPGWVAQRQDAPPNQATGPHFFTAQWRNRRDVRLLPSAAFYPVGWWERKKLGGPYPPESYAVHHWAQGWDLEGKARIDARQ